MKSLSIMEQKQIVGGYWCLKVYNKTTGELKKSYYNTFEEGLAAADRIDKTQFTTILVPIDEPYM